LGHGVADVVEDGKLGGALLGLLQQARGFFEQAHILDRDDGLIGEDL
jgi:hypothetical protein